MADNLTFTLEEVMAVYAEELDTDVEFDADLTVETWTRESRPAMLFGFKQRLLASKGCAPEAANCGYPNCAEQNSTDLLKCERQGCENRFCWHHGSWETTLCWEHEA